jgi:lipopolysaccharide/colanic/teichoic acid biosynthesis glycosyltransferase
VLDVALASLGLVVLAPLLAVLALLVRATSRGPVLFRQTRAGIGMTPFTILKFRTMVADAESRREALEPLNEARGGIFKIRDDPRSTSVGHFLRTTSLDELPQLINVLRGEMSLIGPRPLTDWVIRTIDEPRFFRRFDVPPGMTGLWQIRGRIQDGRRMLEDDLDYVERWSWRLELRILAATPRAVLQGAGRYEQD